jgi:tetratricopeptide (TPR) repeat protein/O-antigen ligase
MPMTMEQKIFQFSDNFQRWFFTLLLLPVAVFFRFVSGTWLVHNNSYPESVLNLIVLSVIFGIWLGWKWFFSKEILITGYEPYFVLFLVVVVLSTILSSNKGLSSEIATGIFVAFGAVYLLLDLKYYQKIWEGLLNTLLITGGINSIFITGRIVYWFRLYGVGWSDLFAHPKYSFDILPRLPNLPSMNSNVTAVYFLILIPLGLSRLMSSERLFWKMVTGFFLMLFLLVIFLTKSRGGLIGIFCMVVVAFALNASQLRKLAMNRPRVAYLIGFLCLLVLSLGTFYVLNNRGLSLSLNQSITSRIQGWRTVLEIIKRRPLLGEGLGTFAKNYLKYRNPENSSLVILHAHNELLQLTAQLGLAGLGSILLLIGVFVKSIYSTSVAGNYRLSSRKKYLCISLAGFVGMGLVDSYLISSNIQLMLLIIFIELMPDSCIKSIPKNNLLLGTATLFYLMLIGIDFRESWQLKPYHEARKAAFNGDWDLAETNINRAVSRDPNNDLYLAMKAQIDGNQACITGEGYSRAIEGFQLNTELYPDWGLYHANLAILDNLRGNHQEAESEILLALDSDPGNIYYECILGDILLDKGEQDQAISHYSVCLMINPGWLDTPYWKQDLQKQSIQDEILDLIMANVQETKDDELLQLAAVNFYMNRIDTTKKILNEYLQINPGDKNALLLQAKLLMSEGRESEAEVILDRIISMNPRESEAWLLKGKQLLNEGRFEAALGTFKISASLSGSSTAYLYQGMAYANMGKTNEERENYYIGIYIQDYPSLFANYVAYRFSMPGERIPCYPNVKTITDYYLPISQIVIELESRDSCQAAWIFNEVFDEKWNLDSFPSLDDLISSGLIETVECNKGDE